MSSTKQNKLCVVCTFLSRTYFKRHYMNMHGKALEHRCFVWAEFCVVDAISPNLLTKDWSRLRNMQWNTYVGFCWYLVINMEDHLWECRVVSAQQEQNYFQFATFCECILRKRKIWYHDMICSQCWRRYDRGWFSSMAHSPMVSEPLKYSDVSVSMYVSYLTTTESESN